MSNLWPFLEDLRGLVGTPAHWLAGLDGQFDLVRPTFLRVRPERARSIPCPHGCGCAHEVIQRADGKLVAICRCESWNCDDIAVKAEDVVLLELNWPKLGRAVAVAFDCDVKEDDLGMAGTRQVAALGDAALPIVLTIQHDRGDFRSVVGQLTARLRSGFVLLAPTNRFLDATARELLANAKAGFFELASHLTLLPSGFLQADRKGGELFAPYLPQPEAAVSEAEAVRVFGLMKRLDTGSRARKAPLERVFRLLVLEGRSQEQVARSCDCSPGLISLRVEAIERKMGRRLGDLKLLASRLGEMASVEDSRAKAIYRRGLTGGSEGDDDGT
jgi:hypothetical protein